MGYECGAFTPACTTKKSQDCSDSVKATPASRQLYDEIVLPQPEKFFLGRCSIHGGEKILVAYVNQSTRACRPCWRTLIALRRSSGDVEVLRPGQEPMCES